MRLIHVLFACMLISVFASPTRGAENSTTKPPLIKGSSGTFENLIEVPAKQASKEMQFNAGAYWLWAGATQAGTEGDTWQWRKFGPYSLEPGKIYIIKFADNVTAEAQPTEEEEEEQEKSQHIVVSFENPQTAPYGFVLEPMTDANKPTSTAPIKQPSIRDKIPDIDHFSLAVSRSHIAVMVSEGRLMAQGH